MAEDAFRASYEREAAQPLAAFAERLSTKHLASLSPSIRCSPTTAWLSPLIGTTLVIGTILAR